ncbi:hypothetical protein TWF281_003721 [Arthrobotrys megalospora]
MVEAKPEGKVKGKPTQIFNDPRRSNITIYCGYEKQAFYLHREVLCLNSPFFEESLEAKPITEIHLPYLMPTAFSVIARWLYDGELEISSDYGVLVLDVLLASKYLKTEELTNHVIQRVINWTNIEAARLAPASKPMFFDFFVDFCEYCNMSHIPHLVSCGKRLLSHFELTGESVYGKLERGIVGNVFVAMIVGSGQFLAQALLEKQQ